MNKQKNIKKNLFTYKVMGTFLFFFAFIVVGLLELKPDHYAYAIAFGLLSVGCGALALYFIRTIFNYYWLLLFVPHVLLFIFALIGLL